MPFYLRDVREKQHLVRKSCARKPGTNAVFCKPYSLPRPTSSEKESRSKESDSVLGLLCSERLFEVGDVGRELAQLPERHLTAGDNEMDNHQIRLRKAPAPHVSRSDEPNAARLPAWACAALASQA